MKPKLFAARLAGIVLATGLAQAFEIASDQQIDGASPQIVGVGDGNTVTPSGAAPNWTYNWADRDGDGSSNAVATAGLTLGEHKFFAARGMSTSRGTIVLDLSGGSITGDSGLAIATYRHDLESTASANQSGSDNLWFRNVASIAMGGIDTRSRHGTGNADYHAGHVTIGEEAARAGSVDLEYLYASSQDTSGTRAGPGDVNIYSSGNVTIAGDLRVDTFGWVGDILIDHVGDLTIGRIQAQTEGARVAGARQSNIALDGGNSSGDLAVGDVFAYIAKTGGSFTGSPESHFDVRNYRHVSIGSISRYNLYPNTSNGFGGHVTITENIEGDISIEGEIDLEHRGSSVGRFGILRLACAGTITLAELDLDKTRFASLSSGSGISTIEGELLNFDADGSGSGSINAPVVTTQTALRVPNDQRLLYKVRDGANADLEGKVYRIANENGQAGTGGLLMPIPTRGTVLLFF